MIGIVNKGLLSIHARMTDSHPESFNKYLIQQIKKNYNVIIEVTDLEMPEEVGLIGAKAYAKRHENELHNFITGSESDFGAGPIYGL